MRRFWKIKSSPTGTHKIVCREWTELVTDYIEGALAQPIIDQIESHLQRCTGCTEYLRQMRATIATVGRLDAADLGAMPDAMRSALFEVYSHSSPSA